MSQPVVPGSIVDDPKRPKKAIVAAVIGAAAAGLSAAVVAFGDGYVSPEEWLTIALAVVVSAGGTFGGTYSVTNPKTFANGL